MRRHRFSAANCLLLVAAVLSLQVNTPAVVRAQAPTESVASNPVLGQRATFTHVTIEQGLSDQRVQAILQDSAGFIWFGTNNGLNRFDGYSVVSYRNDPAHPESLSGNVIEDLYEDRAGTLWVGTRSGLSALDRRTERFTNYRNDPADPRSLSNNRVVAIHEDRSGTLWFGTTGGLNRFDRATGTFTAYRHDRADARSLSHDSVRVITEDRSGVLWIGTLDGLNRLDRAAGTFSVYRHDPSDPRSLSHDVVWDIHEDRAGTLWVGTDGGGLNRFDSTSGAFTHYRHDPRASDSLGDDRVDCLFEDASGALWIGTFGGGLSVLDAVRQSFRTYRHDSARPASLSHNYVAEIIADRSGLIWIGTHGRGVDVYDSRREAFTIYRHEPAGEGLSSNNVWAVAEDHDGIVWIGTQDRGLDRLDRRSGRIVNYPPDQANPHRLGHAWVAALQHDAKGALWVGTYGGGLYRLDPATGRFRAYRHDPANAQSLSHDAITDLHMDRSGALWVGTRGGGLNRFDPARGVFTAYRHDRADARSLSSDWVRAVVEDPTGNLWIGTFDGGLNYLEPATGQITRYAHDPHNPASLGDDSIAALHVDRSGVLWVGTLGGGLDRFDRTQDVFAHYREHDGLASDRITSILEDGSDDDPQAGSLWIGTGRGLSKLDRDRRTFQSYDATHGLPLAEYHRGGETTRRGELLMSSSHGLIAFHPHAVTGNDEHAPPVVFTNFLLANKTVLVGERSPLRHAIDRTSSIGLTYADRVISFEFAALNYRAPRQTRYRYRLEGFDEGWTEIGSTQRTVTYTNLAPGRYVFRVTAANSDGVWNDAGRAIALAITPPWWTTWWFQGLALALIAGGAAGFYAWRVHNLNQRRRELEAEIAERKHAEEALRASHRQIEDLAGRLIAAQEAERARIARELHDEVNQQLAALSITLSTLKRRLPPDLAEGQPELANLQQQALEVSEAIRHLSHELHPAVLQHAGLVAALRGTCAEFGSVHDIEVAFDADPTLGEIPADVGLCLYRVAQEVLHNTARHAAARRVEVVLTSSETNGLELSITDDGRGFDPTAAPGSGLGLISIDERVRLLAGSVRIRSAPGRGTTAWVRVPLRPDGAAPVGVRDGQSESASRGRPFYRRDEPGPSPAR